MVMDITLEKVFGVSKNQVFSYHERLQVDGIFQDALKSDKQIIVYGSSKQGKTALVDKHIPYKDNIVVSLTPKTKVIDIYTSILKDLDIQNIIENESNNTKEATLGLGAAAKISFPLIGGGEAKLDSELKAGDESKVKSTPMGFNIELPNDIAKIINKKGINKFIILENFHYLNEDVQSQLAFDLRTFQELGIRFIILGVWREKNRLTQFNGDLLDRITEVPVEPWGKDEFLKVIEKGSKYMNIDFAEKIKDKIIENAFDSIGVVQELLKSVCSLKYIVVRQAAIVKIDDLSLVTTAIEQKVQDYSSRHTRSLESIAEGRKTTINPDGAAPLFLPYYTVKAFLSFDFEDVVKGIKRTQLETNIKQNHHRSADIRPSDMSNLLYNFATLQSEKKIIPPIFDYDRTTKTMRVVDSTFYFFLRNVDREEILNSISNPLESRNQLTLG